MVTMNFDLYNKGLKQFILEYDHVNELKILYQKKAAVLESWTAVTLN